MKILLRALVVFAISVSPVLAGQIPPAEEVREIARGGYVFGFPMVMGYKLMHAYAIDGKTQLLVANPIDRYLLNSTMEKGFVKGDDGSVTFYIQSDSPGKDLEPNWLPAPDGPFYVVMRLYGPKDEVLAGAWAPPPLEPLE